MTGDYNTGENRKESAGNSESQPERIEQIVQHLRDTLTDEMAARAYQIRYAREPSRAELDAFREELVDEHYDEGFDNWIDRYLYFDTSA
jgi:hypothetical protein